MKYMICIIFLVSSWQMDSDYSQVFDSLIQILQDDSNDDYAYTEVYDAIDTKNASQKNHDYVNVSSISQLSNQHSSSTQINDFHEVEMLRTLRDLDEMLDEEAKKLPPLTPTYVNVDNFSKYPQNDSSSINKPLFRMDVPLKSSMNVYRHSTGDQYNIINFPHYQAPNPLSRYPLIKQPQPFYESNLDISLTNSDHQHSNKLKKNKTDVTRPSRSVSFTSKNDLEKSRIKHFHTSSTIDKTKQEKDNFKSKMSKLFNFLRKPLNKNSPETKQAGKIRIGGVDYENFNPTSHLMQSSTPHLIPLDHSSSSNDLRDSDKKHFHHDRSNNQDYYQLPRYFSDDSFALQQRKDRSHLLPSCISVTKSPIFKSKGNKGILHLNQTQKKTRSEKQKMHDYLHTNNKISANQPNPNYMKKPPLPSNNHLYRIPKSKSVEGGIEHKIQKLRIESSYYIPKCSSTDTNIYSDPSDRIRKHHSSNIGQYPSNKSSNDLEMQKINYKTHDSAESLQSDYVVRPKTKLGVSSLAKNSPCSEVQEKKSNWKKNLPAHLLISSLETNDSEDEEYLDEDFTYDDDGFEISDTFKFSRSYTDLPATSHITTSQNIFQKNERKNRR